MNSGLVLYFDIISASSLNQNHCVAQRLSKGDAISMSNNPTTHSVINLAAVTTPTVTDISITISSTIIKRTVTTGARRCITPLGVTDLNAIIQVISRQQSAINPCGFAPIFPDTCYHLTHYWLAAVDIPVASDNPVHYADAIRYNARTPLQGSLLPLTRLVWA